MLEIKVPRVMQQFGYNLQSPSFIRRESLIKMVKYTGKDSMLFNISTAMFLTKKNNQFEDYNKLKSDFRYIIKKLKIA